jgi:hypothetical protein
MISDQVRLFFVSLKKNIITIYFVGLEWGSAVATGMGLGSEKK